MTRRNPFLIFFVTADRYITGSLFELESDQNQKSLKKKRMSNKKMFLRLGLEQNKFHIWATAARFVGHFPSRRVFFKTWSRTLKINLRALLYCNLALLSRMRLLVRVHGFWFCSYTYGHVTVQIWMIIWVKIKKSTITARLIWAPKSFLVIVQERNNAWIVE